jgi:ribonuclease P protein component
MPLSFKAERRLRRRSEFQRVFETGYRGQGRFLTLVIAPNNTNRTRLGIVASKKLGDAVRRNRAKRLIREIFRQTPPPLDGHGVDIVVIPRRELLDAPYASLENDFRTSLRRSIARLPRRAHD